MLANLDLQISRFPRPGVMLEQNDPEAGDLQLWKIERVEGPDGTCRIVNRALGMVLEVDQAGQSEGCIACAAEWTGARHQQWLIYGDQIL